LTRGYDYAVALTSQFYFCAIPFRLDISPSCSLGCAYCFHASRGGNSQPGSRRADPARV